MPAPQVTRGRVHDHGQIDVLVPQPHVGDVGRPYLVGTLDDDVAHQVREPLQAVIAVGGTWRGRATPVVGRAPGNTQRLWDTDGAGS